MPSRSRDSSSDGPASAADTIVVSIASVRDVGGKEEEEEGEEKRNKKKKKGRRGTRAGARVRSRTTTG